MFDRLFGSDSDDEEISVDDAEGCLGLLEHMEGDE